MSNSPLVNYTKISPNTWGKRTQAIDTITIHCVVGQCTIESLGQVFAPRARKASCNYGIDKNGRIGLILPEDYISQCSSNRANDSRAITIEVASDAYHPYAINTAAYNALVKLCADIAKRNSKIGTLRWKGDKSLVGQVSKQNMTVHRWFANKACPGDYIYNRLGQIANEANALNKRSTPISNSGNVGNAEGLPKPPFLIKVLIPDLNYRSRPVMSAPVVTTLKEGFEYKIVEVDDGWGRLEGVTGWVYLLNDHYVKIQNEPTPPSGGFKVNVNCTDLHIRTGPGTDYSALREFIHPGVYTITETRAGAGSKAGWGKLKSGIGWISLDFVERV